MAFLNLTSPRPDKHVDRSTWNKSWEDDLKRYESLRLDVFANIPVDIPTGVRNYADAMISQTRLWLEKQTQGICVLQKDIRDYALPRLATDDLEEKWKRLVPDRRKDILLEALYKTSCAGPDMEDHRKWCPEMTLLNLSAKNGWFFIDVLKKILTDDPTKQRSQPILFAHPIVDPILQHEFFGSIKSGVESNRCYFISMAVWRILLAFYDDDEAYILAKQPRQSTIASGKEILTLAEQTFGKGVARLIRQDLKALNKRLAGQITVCWHCGKDPSRLPAGSQLKACSKCKEIGRSIRYCSKECQRDDWKKGTPRPHKFICGLPLMEMSEGQTQEASQKGSDCNDKIPEPDPSFKRTPALLHQITLLKQEQNSDYVLMRPGRVDPDVGIQIADNQIRKIFLILRRRALTSGDRIAVNFMCQILHPIAFQSRFTTGQLVSQLEKEYGVKVDVGENVSSNLEDPTEEEEEWVNNLIQSFENPSACSRG